MAAAHHHMEATAQQADSQALREVTRAQDGHRGLHGDTGRPRICSSNAVLHAVGQETGLGVVEVVGGGRCEEHWAPAAAHHRDGVHASSLSLLLGFST